MGFIYKIVNDINNKIYVGQTINSIEERFKEHKNDSKRRKTEQRPLYRAMNKYGTEHFHIELIEECENDKLQEREIYWIAYYRGYEDGYNATHGGDGRTLYDHEAIKQELLKNPRPKQVAEKFGCCKDIVIDIAHQYGIQSINDGQNNFLASSKIVYQYSKDNQFIQSFPSVAEAAKWCYENGKCKELNSGVRGHIVDVCNNKPKRKSAYGYIWKYL